MARKQHLPLIAAGFLLSLGSGCLTTDASKTEAKKPDVTKPGVLPPPQDMTKPASAVAPTGTGPSAPTIVQAGATQPAAPAPAGTSGTKTAAPAPVANPVAGLSAAAKQLTPWAEKKVLATDMAVAWGPRIAHLPDPTKNGAMGSGIVGQMFLYGGPKMEFVQADGTLTVDLIDETPRAPGQPAATPERWQFDKNALRSLQMGHETFGKSYVLFLPWPAYRPDITKVRISARYDPEHGHTLYAAPRTVSIDATTPFGAPVWNGMTTTVPLEGPGAGVPKTTVIGAGATLPTSAPPLAAPAPIPVGGGPRFPQNAALEIGAPGAPTFPLAPGSAPGRLPDAPIMLPPGP